MFDEWGMVLAYLKRFDREAPMAEAIIQPEHFKDKVTGQQRALGLDALRGFAILTMAFSGYIPWHVLPAWMYHAQLPPPTNVFNPAIPGITWVDLVFPFFLFSMGAAIPLALSRRVEKGVAHGKIILYTLERGFLLAAFAVYIQHIRPWAMSSSPDTLTWLTALVGLLILFPMFIRLPKSTSTISRWGIKCAGWGAAIILLASLRYPDGKGFSFNRFDIIIMVLANTVVSGSFIWLLTRQNLLLRLGVIGIVFALRLSSTVDGSWAQDLWNYSPTLFGFSLRWLFRFEFHKYLLIVLPGTIIGDMLLTWMKKPKEEGVLQRGWEPGRYLMIAALMVAFNVFLLVGLHSRWLVTTNLVSFVMCLIGWWFVSKATNPTERLMKNLFLWGAYWLILGLFLEPFEGGIKKDHATFSYFFVTTGLAIFLMMAFMIIIDILDKRKWLAILVYNGQNPMIAYAAIQNLVLPCLILTGISTLALRIFSAPWPGAFWGIVMTLLLGIVVSIFTRLKIFWRT